MKVKPLIHGTTPVCQSRLFEIETVHLEFSNGAKRDYERLRSRVTRAVVVMGIHENNLVLIREYCVGLEQYLLGFPKGLIDPGETNVEAANRELQEEAGFGSRQLEYRTTLSMNPGYTNMLTDLIIARDLYPASLPGDEPEPLDVVLWPMDKIPELLAREDFNEARSIACLMYL
jgi:ADP-ribose diphosphatase